MVINGQQRKLVARRDKETGCWGVRESIKNHGAWVSEGGGYTTSLRFHGRIFADKQAAQDYVDGYEQARQEALAFFKGWGG